MIDFHTHILPGIDDGSKNVEMSLEMLEMMKNQGVKTVVATPHFYADRDNPESFLRHRSKAFESLSEAMKGKEGMPEIILAAEVTYFEGMSDCDELKKLAIGTTNLILIEMPTCQWNKRIINEVLAVYEKQNLIPVIAHLDRYIRMFGDKHLIDVFDGSPALIQLNTSYFNERKYHRKALKLLAGGKISFIGSDCHNTVSRLPNMSEARVVIEKGKLIDIFNEMNKKAENMLKS